MPLISYFAKLALSCIVRLSINLWSRSGTIMASCWRWTRQSSTHAVLAALALSVAFNLWQWHHATAAKAAFSRRISAWQNAFASEQQAFHTLFGAMVRQNASIDAWREAGSARQRAAKDALKAAAARAQNREFLAQRILGEAITAPVPPDRPDTTSCRTPKSVMDARAQL